METEKSRRKKWTPCNSHQWVQIEKLLYRCDSCLVAGYPINKSNPTCNSRIAPYVCPQCKGNTLLPKGPCPNCFPGVEDPEPVCSHQEMDEIIAGLTPSHLFVLQRLDGHTLPQLVTRVNGSFLGHLERKGYIISAGKFSPPYMWMISKLGTLILVTLEERGKIERESPPDLSEMDCHVADYYGLTKNIDYTGDELEEEEKEEVFPDPKEKNQETVDELEETSLIIRNVENRLTYFVYALLKDHIIFGRLEDIVGAVQKITAEQEVLFSNPRLEVISRDIVDKLLYQLGVEKRKIVI